MRIILMSLFLLCLLGLNGCPSPIFAPIEPAYDKDGKLRTDGHFVRDDFMRKMSEDLKACQGK